MQFKIGQVWDIELNNHVHYYGKTARIICLDANRKDSQKLSGWALIKLKSGYEECIFFDPETGIIPYVGKFIKEHKEPRTKTVWWWRNFSGYEWVVAEDNTYSSGYKNHQLIGKFTLTEGQEDGVVK